ncbi:MULTISPECIES: HTH-type transcriptional regulator ArgP [unclassified Polaromonas]|jgi:LysR family transcriptional regulator (chromosome initiation inhibitor)|uniref:HTH-type transcriptional regulator ArgP n=1 Tax=unclassified Polaromonas TaxID=2638319 RepID=UPI0018C917D8|nr:MULTISPECIES: HTH-type transcriptional regulator ArgP [unclassified Polaromonas]MBG6073221.1 LysR family transcriptional regulator (chromosome initiation inhibitor) [Polaromonas sp. CG_9.7]MBG6115269.1 LysR family transcriptional regulator (chromosome initiation inhibitor) [Polaromonas sp. CG_9.2]MDH6183495.1 LysR family transcriptional regulator (chromosome initiation inhibitor) [Polaromonas sp. CG_23.6]
MLDPRQLEALAAVIESGSFGAAAKSLSVTLAAVSLRIKSLEAALGQRLLVRGKQVRATPAGQALLGHVKQLRLMEADLMAGLPGAGADSARLQTLSVAVNADSLASWFLPGVAPALQQHRLLLDVVVDDQDHTHDALKSGDVTGCVTTLAQPMRGCVAEPLGIMRYRCVAAPALVAEWGSALPHRMLRSPAVIFNRKDALQDAWLAQHFNLQGALYPRHFVPAVDAFELALELGLGWGMVPDLLLKARKGRAPLQEVVPGQPVDVVLYWQHWAREPLAAERLTQAIKRAAQAHLLQS